MRVVLLVLVVIGCCVLAVWAIGRRKRAPSDPTPEAAADGREREGPPGSGAPGRATHATRPAEQSQAEQVVAAYGGFDNVTSIAACITRLRMTVKDKTLVDKRVLKSLGAAGVLEIGDSMQAIFGSRAETLKAEILDLKAREEH